MIVKLYTRVQTRLELVHFFRLSAAAPLLFAAVWNPDTLLFITAFGRQHVANKIRRGWNF